MPELVIDGHEQSPVCPFLRMDENFSIMPHGVNFQDPIFPDTPENHRIFASLFQFANCTAGTQVHTYTPEWEAQEDSRVRCPPPQISVIINGHVVQHVGLLREFERLNVKLQ